MTSVTFNINMAIDGRELVATVSAEATVKQIKDDIEKELGVQEPAYVKLICEGDVLLPSKVVSELQSTELFGVVSMEQDVQVLKQAASSYERYTELMQDATVETVEGSKIATTRVLPTILEVLEDMAGERKELPEMRQEEDGKVRFWGRCGELLMPSLKAAGLKRVLGVESLEEVTIIVGCNSDCYNQGLGVGLEASPLMNCTVDEKGVPSYMYNGYGLTEALSLDKEDGSGKRWRTQEPLRRNVVKFHPGMSGAELRCEGVGGWTNTSVGFNPEALSNTKGALHTLRLTMRTSGVNTIEFQGVDCKGNVQQPAWCKTWNRELFDGDHIPSMFAFLDLGSQETRGVVYSRIQLQARGKVDA
jgi:hypothetical protein